MASSGHDDEPKYARYQAIALAWNVGWPIAAGVIVGSWLDGKLGTSPLFILVFSLGSLVVTVYRLVQTGSSQPGEDD